MKAVATPRLRAYVTAGLVGLGAALAVGDPGPALVGTALLALAIVGLATRAIPSMTARIDKCPNHMVEGGEYQVSLHLETDRRIGPLFVEVGLEDMDVMSTVGGRLVDRATLVDSFDRPVVAGRVHGFAPGVGQEGRGTGNGVRRFTTRHVRTESQGAW